MITKTKKMFVIKMRGEFKFHSQKLKKKMSMIMNVNMTSFPNVACNCICLKQLKILRNIF